MINDLKSLGQSQKKFLVMASYAMMISDEYINQIEVGFTIPFFEEIGISINKFREIIEEI
jgi:hypothetical protein